MLSISFLSESDSIQRKTRIAGETITKTESQKPILRSQRARGLERACARTGAALAAHAVHFVFCRTCSSSSASATMMHEEHDDDGRGVADVVEREGLQIEVDVDRLRRGARPALR